MNDNSIIKTLKPSHLIYDKSHNLHIGFDDTKICIISQGFEYINTVEDITEIISNKKFNVRATHNNTKIICVGFLSYYVLNKNCTDASLSTIAINYYNPRFKEYIKNKMDRDKAKAEYPSFHLSEENEFFDYAQKNFFPLLPDCDIEDLTTRFNEYVLFVNTLNETCSNKDFQNDNELLIKYNDFATSIQPFFETRIDGTYIRHIIEKKKLPIGMPPLKFNEKDKFINIWYFIDIFQIPMRNMKIITNEKIKHNQKSSKSNNDFAEICTALKKISTNLSTKAKIF